MSKDFIGGRNPVMEALKSGRDINKIWIAEGSQKGSIQQIVGLAKESNVMVQYVPKKKIEQMANQIGMLEDAHQIRRLQHLYGYYLEKICYRPLRSAPKLTPLISALGASIFLQNFVMITIGAKDRIFPLTVGMRPITAGGVTFTPLQATIILSSILLMALLWWFINRTKLGIAIKATSTDPFMAQLSLGPAESRTKARCPVAIS